MSELKRLKPSGELARRIIDLFFVRRDVYGLETENGWITVKEPVTVELVERHLRGEVCLGAHLIGPNGECRWVGWDIDNPYAFPVFLKFFNENFPRACLVHTTGGRSFHVKVFFTRPIRSEDAYKIAKSVAEKLNVKGLDFFPKQPRITETGFGNFMRLPLGRHARTGEFGALVHPKSLLDIKPCPPPDWCITPFKFLAGECAYRVKECRMDSKSGVIIETGDFCCTYNDGTVGYCRENLCPRIPPRLH